MTAMDFSIELFLIVLGPLLVLAIFFFFRHRAKLRTRAFRDLAKRRGWEFEAETPEQKLHQWGAMPLFERGRNSQATNRLSGQTDGFEFSLFDYRYVTGGGKNSSTHKQSAVCLHSERLKLPAFELRPENIGHKFIALFGYQDFDFAASPEFSARYLLRGAQEKQIRKLFSSSLRRRLEKDLGWYIEGDDSHLLIYRHRKRCKPEEAQALIRTAIGIAQRFAD